MTDLLGEQTDLTPARHVPETAMEAQDKLHESWGRLDGSLDEVRARSRILATIDLSGGGDAAFTVTVSDLDRAHALKLRQGQTLPGELSHGDALPQGAVPVLSVPDLVQGGESGGWLAGAEVEKGVGAGSLTVAEPGDVVVVGVERAYRVRVQVDAPLVLAPSSTRCTRIPNCSTPGFSRAACELRRTRGRPAPTPPAQPASWSTRM